MATTTPSDPPRLMATGKASEVESTVPLMLVRTGLLVLFYVEIFLSRRFGDNYWYLILELGQLSLELLPLVSFAVDINCSCFT